MKIIVGASSPESFEAVCKHLDAQNWGIDVAVTIVYVVEPSQVTDLMLSLCGKTQYKTILGIRMQEAQSCVNRLTRVISRTMGPQAQVTAQISFGRLFDTLKDTAVSLGADVMVVGLEEPTFINRFLPDSRIADIAAKSPCPVMFVTKPAVRHAA
jgi:nucleotide-binding universal stress UspA family protein